MSKTFADVVESDIAKIGILWTESPSFRIVRIFFGDSGKTELRRTKDTEKALALLLSELAGEDASHLEPTLAIEALKPFAFKTLNTLRKKIPRGKVISYGALATLCGHPGAARAIGTALHNNPFPLFLPCHRVVGADGSLGGFGSGVELKKRLLITEGIEFNGKNITPKHLHFKEVTKH